MHLITFLSILYASTVAANPLLSINVCAIESIALSALHKYSQASSFCTTFIGIKTSTSTVVSTVTPPPIVSSGVATATASLVSVTSTVSTGATVTSANIVTITPTSTVTVTSTETDQSTCISSALAPGVPAKRALTSSTSKPSSSTSPTTPTLTKPASITSTSAIKASSTNSIPSALSPCASSALSTACSCLSLPTPSTTITSTTTIPPKTVTTTVQTTVTPTTTIVTTVTSTTTVSSATTTTASAISTTTTVTSTTVNVVPTGLSYYYYTGPEPYNNDYSGVPAVVDSISGNPNYQYSGTVQNINTIFIPFGQYFTLPNSGNTVPGVNFAMVFQGYLYASAGAGTYTITSNIDDIGLVWLGPNKAYGTLWKYGNADYVNYCCLNGPSSTSVTLAAGEAYPITLFFANSGGQGSSDFEITTPDGSLHKDTSPFFVGACDGQALFEP